MNKEIEWLLKEKYNGEKSEGFFTDCERLASGEPLAYVIGFAPFLDIKIWLDSKPLIPRPETEYWVGKAIEAQSKNIPQMTGIGCPSLQKLMNTECSSVQVLDMCAGSGAIGVVVAKALPEARVDFAEIDTSHHSTIIRNICDNGIEYSTTRVFGGDLFSLIPNGTLYNAILSNPPYIDPALDRVHTSVKEHEPHLALYGGEGGLEIIKRILHDAPPYLKADGHIYIEHEPEQAHEISKIASSLPYTTITHREDQYGIVRFTILTRA